MYVYAYTHLDCLHDFALSKDEVGEVSTAKEKQKIKGILKMLEI